MARELTQMMLEWLQQTEVIAAMFAVSIVMFLGSLIVMPVLIVRMRRDYFMHRTPPPESWRRQHATVRFTILAIKNALGAILFFSGIAMLVLPGQGIITILVGISLLNFPGKRRLELLIVRQRQVLAAINWIRARAKRPPLILPDRET